ncbi:uncharacterized protein LTR77_009005 [Saxophila tyrrhenica]|uniref:Pre-mRNA polyadenylation factor Fip1 domain-containing protein n=1 Tax=Saxophila tyrrhenica TaxID=1690608 RepID=A0AAV9NZ92_9PEZI|nr:hypothetical protein LTR77_009005 [Saxophila tyrrhenica]
MEEEDDDFYGGQGGNAQEDAPTFDEANIKDEKMEVTEEQEDEEVDSDDDIQFTLEKPQGEQTETRSAPPQPKKQRTGSGDRAVSAEIKPGKSSTPVKHEQRTASTQPTAVRTTLTHDGKEGKDFPEIRSSKVDVSTTPAWPANNKPITELDIDADLAEHSKPWRLPGTDQTDFFNYGFDEYTWAQYCIRQQTMAGNISDMKQQDAQMKAMFGGGPGGPGGGGMPGGMPGMPGMGGMPSPEEMMQQMMSQGIDPSDPNAFMQMMMGGGGGGGPGQPNQHQGGGGGGFGPQRGGFGGSNPNSVSPRPPGGQQGFQPPTGPSAQNQGGDQGGFGGGMDGYSQQQMAIMQGGMGGRGRGRGRGRYY